MGEGIDVQFGSACAEREGNLSLDDVRRQYIAYVLRVAEHDLATASRFLALTVGELKRQMRRLNIS